MNENNQLLIFAAVAAGLYFYSKQNKTGGSNPALANTTAGRPEVTQTSPRSNNPNVGVNTNKGTTGIGEQTQSVINGVKTGYDTISGIFKGIGGSGNGQQTTPKLPSNNPTHNPSFDNLDGMQDDDYTPGITDEFDSNNNATDNQSFDDLDHTGEQMGGWGSENDVASMTV